MIQCLRCGRCCHTLTEVKLSRQEYDYLRSLKPIIATATDNEKYLMPLPCPFQAESGECSIHDTRPTWCRMYHCGKIKEGDKVLKYMADVNLLMSENPEYKKFRIEMEDAAAAYGNDHGWNWRRHGV